MDLSKICEQGGREYNQDYADFAEKNGKFCVAVADGLGSYDGSEIASKTAVDFCISWFDSAASDDNCLTKKSVKAAVKAAHNEIIKLKSSDPYLSASCTTLALLVSDGKTSVMAHLGDTRIYEIKKGKIYKTTKDHSLAQVAVDKGEITRSQLRYHVNQNKLLKVLGGVEYCEPDISTDFFELEEGDGFLVCTDGMWEYVFEDEIADVFAAKTSAYDKITAFKAFHDLRASETCDNYTAVIAVKGEKD
jgi:serine/threonine protein phosphatase PrpC